MAKKSLPQKSDKVFGVLVIKIGGYDSGVGDVDDVAVFELVGGTDAFAFV